VGPVIVIVVLAAGIGLLLWWGSRHRGETLMSVHQRLQKRRKPR